MKEHDATEIAFKNGYKKAASDIFEEIEKIATSEGAYDYVSIQEVAELKKKYTGGGAE